MYQETKREAAYLNLCSVQPCTHTAKPVQYSMLSTSRNQAPSTKTKLLHRAGQNFYKGHPGKTEVLNDNDVDLPF